MALSRSYFKFQLNKITPLLICGAAILCGNKVSHADEFSLVPAGSPIYSQLGSLDKFQDGMTRSSNLTRYEAALQVARILATASSSPERFTKANWRTLSTLIQSLKAELRLLGVDTELERVRAEKNATAPVAKAPAKPPVSNLELSSAGNSLTKNLGIRAGDLESPLLLRGAGTLGLENLNPSNDSISDSSVVFPISQRLRAGAALLSMQRAQNDLFGTSSTVSRNLGSSTSLAYDFNSWLTVRAISSKRDLQNIPGKEPVLSAPLFAGANTAKSAGGGLDLNLGAVRFSGDVERFSDDDRILGTKVGGGLGISAWQNRLSMSAHLSRLVPEDRAVLKSTAAELNVGLGISERLSLNLMYQGMFTNQNDSSNSRVAGGLSLNF